MTTSKGQRIVTEEKTTRIPSNALLQKINDIVGSFGRTRDKVIAAFELGRKEGFSDKEIGDMVRKAMKQAGFTRHYITDLLPPTAKNKHVKNPLSANYLKMERKRHNAARRIRTSSRKPEEYETGELWEYTKDFLIRIIKWYEEKEVILQQKQAELQTLLQPINKRRMVSTDGGPAIK